MRPETEYFIFKSFFRAFATALVIFGWLSQGTAIGGALFWAGIVITIISFFL